MLNPGTTGSGESVFVTTRSAIAQLYPASAPAMTLSGDVTTPGNPGPGDLFDRLRVELEKAHTYEVPEVVAVPIVAGAPNYLAWLDKAVSASGV